LPVAPLVFAVNVTPATTHVSSLAEPVLEKQMADYSRQLMDIEKKRDHRKVKRGQ